PRSPTLLSFLHFHPDYTLSYSDGVIVATTMNGPRVVVRPFGVDEVSIHTGGTEPPMGWFSPEFGIAKPSSVARFSIASHDGRDFRYVLTAGSPGQPDSASV